MGGEDVEIIYMHLYDLRLNKIELFLIFFFNFEMLICYCVLMSNIRDSARASLKHRHKVSARF